jgi:sec-independent protein translocase protein TatB
MFGMGWQEILLILVVAVLVIGPDQLPQVARTIGKLIAQFRRITNDLRDTVNREFTENEDFKDFREFHQSIDSEFRDVGHMAKSYVEKEIASEEAELRKFGEQVASAGHEASSAMEDAATEGAKAAKTAGAEPPGPEGSVGYDPAAGKPAAEPVTAAAPDNGAGPTAPASKAGEGAAAPGSQGAEPAGHDEAPTPPARKETA